MDTIQALRIELYEELQGLPEALRSEFPDLAVDFLATVFRAPPASSSGKPAPTSGAHNAVGMTRQLTAPAAAPAFQLLPPSNAKGSASDGPLPEHVAGVRAILEEAQKEAADIEATASAAPAGGWGDLALPLLRAAAAPATAARQQSGGSRATSPADATSPPPAQLMECRRCRKVLLACSALEHHRKCSQREDPAADAGSLSEAHSSSEGAVPIAPSASRGSKRKRLTGAAAAAASAGGGGTGKQSKLSQGTRRRALSVEASPSLGEVVQGKMQHELAIDVPLAEPLAVHVPPILPAPVVPAVAAAAEAAPVAAAAAAPTTTVVAAVRRAGVIPREPLSPTVQLTQQQRRRRSQHPPRLRRRYLHLHPGMDLAQPLLLNDVASPATHVRPAPAATGAAASQAAAGAAAVPLLGAAGSPAAAGATVAPTPGAAGSLAAAGAVAASAPGSARANNPGQQHKAPLQQHVADGPVAGLPLRLGEPPQQPPLVPAQPLSISGGSAAAPPVPRQRIQTPQELMQLAMMDALKQSQQAAAQQGQQGVVFPLQPAMASVQVQSQPQPQTWVPQPSMWEVPQVAVQAQQAVQAPAQGQQQGQHPSSAQQQQQLLRQPTKLQPQQQQQPQQQSKPAQQDQCRIFQSLTPEQQKHIREQILKRKQQQQQQQQQGAAAQQGSQAATAVRPAGTPAVRPQAVSPLGQRPMLLPQQMQQLYQQNPAMFQQYMQQRAVLAAPLGRAPSFPPGGVAAQPLGTKAAPAPPATASSLPTSHSSPMLLSRSGSSSTLQPPVRPPAMGAGYLVAGIPQQPLRGPLPGAQQPQLVGQATVRAGSGSPAPRTGPLPVPGIAVGIPLPRSSSTSALGASAGTAGMMPMPMPRQVPMPVRPGLPVYPSLRPLPAPATGTPMAGLPSSSSPAIAGRPPAGMMPLPFQQQALVLVPQPHGTPPAMQFVPVQNGQQS